MIESWPRWSWWPLPCLLAVTVSFWWAPPPGPEAEFYGVYRPLGAGAGFVVNQDADVFCEAAAQPEQLLRPGFAWQSRPLYILAGSLLGRPLAWLWAHLPGLPADPSPDGLGAYYLAYLLLNAVLLWASLWLLAALARAYGLPRQGAQLWPLGWLLLSQPVTKAFFWTAHLQMFTLLVPLLALYGMARLRATTWPSWRWTVAGLGLLAYGSFLLLLPCWLLALVQRAGGWRQAWAPMVRATLAFLLPLGLWAGLLTVSGIGFYSHEVQAYGQFVWLIEAAQAGLPALGAQLGAHLRAFGAALRPEAGLLALAGVCLWLARRRPSLPSPLGWDLLGVGALFTLFFAMLGHYSWRLTFFLHPLLVVWLLGLLAPLPRWAWRLTAVAVGGWHLWQLTTYGPFD